MFWDAEVVGCDDDVKVEALNNPITVSGCTRFVGCTTDVEGEKLNTPLTVFWDTGVVGCKYYVKAHEEYSL